MKELIRACEIFVMKTYKQYQGKFGSNFMILVTKKMINIILEENPKHVNVNALILGAYLHDIGRVKDDSEQHTFEGVKIALKFFKSMNFDDKYTINIVKDCILNHGSSAKPLTKEGELVQKLDKIVLIDKDVVSIYMAQLNKKLSLNEAMLAARSKLEKWFTSLSYEDQSKYRLKYVECLEIFK